MAQSKKKLSHSKAKESTPQLELVQPSSHNPFWRSSLFNEVYLQNDVPIKYKELWESYSTPFDEFCAQFRHLCEDLKDADFSSWSERNTINRLIKPVLRMLGYVDRRTPRQEPWAEDEPFTVMEGGELKTYKPDLIIVNDARELKYIERKKGQEKLEEARSSVIVPIEAKYWDRIEDISKRTPEDSKRADKKDQTDATRALDFDEQCLKYMEILNKDYGILTDGKTWRLYNSELSSDSYRRNFQFNLGHLIKHVNAGINDNQHDLDVFTENAKYFFHIFSKRALASESGERRFVDDLLEYSKTYVTKVEEDLKTRFVKAMAHACNGFQRSIEQAREKVDLSTIRNVAESHLFNILFIRHCESRGILPLKQSEYRKISLSNTIAKLEYFNPEREEDDLNRPVLERMFSKDFSYDPDGKELYERLLDLTKIVQEGTNSKFEDFEIEGFKESIFSKEEWKFVQNHRLTNFEMVNILFELGYCASDVAGRRFQQIPYNFFSPRQLGSIYESFLEFRLDKASEDMAFIKKQWVPANLKSEKIRALPVAKVKKGQLFFTPDNTERKATGSYYTPDYIVRLIVRNALEPITRGRSTQELLKIRICDPAMGSGHFLNGCLNYLATVYLEKLEEETNDDLNVSLVDARQLVLHSCIYGVDLNPRAVKLAKMGLWLEIAAPESRLAHLDDQLKCGDSIIHDANMTEYPFDYKKQFPTIFSAAGGFDAVVGNPPWVSFGLRGTGKLEGDTKKYLAKTYPGSAEYKVSLYACFLDRFIQLANENGHVGIIIPDSFLLGMYFSKLRRTILDTCAIETLTLVNGDFWGTGICSGFNVIAALRKESSKGVRHKNTINCHFFDGGKSLEKGEGKHGVVPQAYYEQKERGEFRLFFSEEDYSFVDAMERNFTGRVKKFVKFSSGLIANTNKEDILSKTQKSKKWHPGVISGGQVNAEMIAYDDDFISFDQRHLKSGFKDARYFETKLVVRQTGDRIICGYDDKHYLYLNNVHVGNLQEGCDKRALKLVFLLLNSPEMVRYYRLITLEEGRAMAQIDIANLDELPVPEATESNLCEASEIVDKFLRGKMDQAQFLRSASAFVTERLRPKKKAAA